MIVSAKTAPRKDPYIVDEHTQLAELLHMLLDGALAVFVLHEVDFNDVALAAFLFFDNILDFFSADAVMSAL